MSTTTKAPKAYTEFVDFVTSRPSLEDIIAFRPSALTSKRVDYLVDGHHDGALSSHEYRELIEYARAEDLLNNLRVRARRRLSRS